ncbi:MAG: PQQ-dependent sugar dehydrogenase, partial [Pseudomonadota bacterium]
LFVVEQAGRIRVIDRGGVLPEPFLDIRDRVDSGGEKGLLSVAFHPRFRENGFFYVNYTANRNGLHTVVSRFRVAEGKRVDPADETVLLRIDQPYSNHNGGQIAFGPDGYLYIGMGDGGAANDPHNHAQNPASLLGKMLRIDVDKTDPGLAYSIPKDNPFVGRSGYRAEIWALGLRNPWRFSFDAGSGRLWAADVGQNQVEEIDIIRRGGNYGWRIMEGDICTPGIDDDCRKDGLEPPLHIYRHPAGFSITGGHVYRGKNIAGLCGTYVFGDYVTKRLWGLRTDGQRVRAHRELGKGRFAVSSFGVDEAGELYIADHASGTIWRVVTAR